MNNYIDLKKTTWERVFFSDDLLDEVRSLIKTGKSATHINHFLTNDKECEWENLNEADEFLSPEENGGEPTIELYEPSEKNHMKLTLINKPK